jgi:hypothetical protein
VLRAFEGAPADESLAEKISEVTLHLVVVAGVGVSLKVVCGDNTELAEVHQCADFGATQSITVVAIIEQGAGVPETHVWQRHFRAAHSISRWLVRSDEIGVRLRTTLRCVELTLALCLDGIQEVLPFVEWIETRHG